MQLRKADALTGIALVVLGLVVYRETLKFPRDLPSVQASGWYSGPWIVPGTAALVLALMGAGLFVFAVRNGGRWTVADWGTLLGAVRRLEFRRILTVMGLLVAYIGIAIGRIHFTLATFLFMVAFMGIFRATSIIRILAISAVSSVVVSWVFNVLGRVPLP